MEKKEVPQDKGLTEGLFDDICYALDENGKYTVVPTTGWQPKTDAMLQAWDVVNEKVAQVRQQVLAGELSPIAYYMEKNIMDVKLLADYMGLPKRKVRKHLKAGCFNKIDNKVLERYAKTFGITLDILLKFPETLKDK
jgi:hypothetical protein